MTSSPKIKLSLQHILNQHLHKTSSLNNYQRGILKLLQHCKTDYFGGHWQACDNCGELRKHYNSCSNRHCPGCQGANRERWLLEREYDLFDVPHFHVTFTVPAELRMLFYHNQKVMYNLLFKCMWSTLRSFSTDPRSRLEAQTGVIAILHTWTQQLNYHPHLHCIVPAGGLTDSGHWKSKNGKFLFSVESLSFVFKNKFCDELSALLQSGTVTRKSDTGGNRQFIHTLRKKKWVINSKPGFAGKGSVIEYLGRYTHKIAISNYRLIKLQDNLVTFSYRDRKAGDIKKVMTLGAEEFIRRFSWHILPKGFVKIRHYGLFATRVKKEKVAQVKKELGQKNKVKPEKLTVAQVIYQTTGRDIHCCPSCREGRVMVIKEIPPARGSPHAQVSVNPLSS